MTYNTKFPNQLDLHSESFNVTNRSKGLFWVDSPLNAEYMMKNRAIIDAWCEYKRAQEEKSLLERDAHLFRKHCIDDIDILGGPLEFRDDISEAMQRSFIFMLARLVGKIKAQVGLVADIHSKLDINM